MRNTLHMEVGSGRLALGGQQHENVFYDNNVATQLLLASALPSWLLNGAL